MCFLRNNWPIQYETLTEYIFMINWDELVCLKISLFLVRSCFIQRTQSRGLESLKSVSKNGNRVNDNFLDFSSLPYI